jgi:hypothetical protein
MPADETPTDPSANDLDLGVPTACQIGSTVVLPKNPKTKNRREKKNRTQEADPGEADHYKRVDEASHNSLADFLYTKSRIASKWKSAVYKREANVYEGAAREK